MIDLALTAADLLDDPGPHRRRESVGGAHNFVRNEIHDELAAEEIHFTAANRAAVAAREFKAMRPYGGGQQLSTGAQAEVFAGHFIANYVKTLGGGKTYAQLSTEAQADPTNTKLAAAVATVFKCETSRGLLLNAYAIGGQDARAHLSHTEVAAGPRRRATPRRLPRSPTLSLGSR